MTEDRTPILVGAAQLTQKDVDPVAALEPVAMMAETARRAAADAGATETLLERVDCVGVVNILGHDYGNAPRALAERAGASAKTELYTAIGGNSPQFLLNEVAARIADGRVGLALLSGAEALATASRARKAGITLDWTPTSDGPRPETLGEDKPGTNGHESTHGLQMPIQVYPLFENALRARAGRDPKSHLRTLGELYAGFSRIAAENPHAWFRSPRTAEEISTVTPSNRMIGFPYPKLMNAIMDVDQSASLILTSVANAKSLGIPQERWIYVLGTGDAHDHWYLSDRADFASSPAIRAAGAAAMEMAGVTIDRVRHIDLYSCFPSAVQIARDALGIPAADPRPLTVTGGLAYAGGPASNYPMHSIATLVARLRADRGAVGLATGLGWYVTKHSIGIYGTEPSGRPWRRREPADLQAQVDRGPKSAVEREPSGRGTIETYTVLHDRDGAPIRGIVVGRLADGRRFFANTPEHRDVLESLMAKEAIGREGTVTSGEVNRFSPD